MASYRVRVKRTETYVDDVEIEAASSDEAETLIQAKLDEGGWDAVFDEDGDYDECYSDAVSATEVEEDDE